MSGVMKRVNEASPARSFARRDFCKCASAGLGLSALALGAPGLLGCAGGDEGALLLGGERVAPEVIDRDPLSLLPGSVVMLSYVDAAMMFASRLGPDMNQLIAGLFPLGPESNFVPARDVVKMYGGMYAMQGADFCIVLQGNFDVPTIYRAAEAKAMTGPGAPLVKSRYADMDLFTAGRMGFVLLTNHTVLSGNETGIRRALDRLRRNKLTRSVPKWMVDLSNTKGAAYTLAGDFSNQPAVEAAAPKLPFVTGMKYVRIIGNFQPPGMNFAGAFTYSDPQSAANGAAALQNLQQVASFMSMISSWGMGGSVPPMQVAQSGNDTAFTLPMEESMVRLLIKVGAETVKKALMGV